MAVKLIRPPLTDALVRSLKAGDEVIIAGTIYTARDMAHKRLCEAINNRSIAAFRYQRRTHLFLRPDSRSARQTYRRSRPDNLRKDGCLQPHTYRRGPQGDARQGLSQSGRPRCPQTALCRSPFNHRRGRGACSPNTLPPPRLSPTKTSAPRQSGGSKSSISPPSSLTTVTEIPFINIIFSQ